jgi:hypothetical protein
MLKRSLSLRHRSLWQIEQSFLQRKSLDAVPPYCSVLLRHSCTRPPRPILGASSLIEQSSANLGGGCNVFTLCPKYCHNPSTLRMAKTWTALVKSIAITGFAMALRHYLKQGYSLEKATAPPRIGSLLCFQSRGKNLAAQAHQCDD